MSHFHSWWTDMHKHHRPTKIKTMNDNWDGFFKNILCVTAPAGLKCCRRKMKWEMIQIKRYDLRQIWNLIWSKRIRCIKMSFQAVDYHKFTSVFIRSGVAQSLSAAHTHPHMTEWMGMCVLIVPVWLRTKSHMIQICDSLQVPPARIQEPNGISTFINFPNQHFVLSKIFSFPYFARR